MALRAMTAHIWLRYVLWSLYLTLDQQVVFSVARITGVANLSLRMWSSSEKHHLLLTWAPGLGVEPGPGDTKLMRYH